MIRGSIFVIELGQGLKPLDMLLIIKETLFYVRFYCMDPLKALLDIMFYVGDSKCNVRYKQ